MIHMKPTPYSDCTGIYINPSQAPWQCWSSGTLPCPPLPSPGLLSACSVLLMLSALSGCDRALPGIGWHIQLNKGMGLAGITRVSWYFINIAFPRVDCNLHLPHTPPLNLSHHFFGAVCLYMLKEDIYFYANLEDTQLQKKIEALSNQKPHFSLRQEFKNESACLSCFVKKVLWDRP